MDRFGEKSKFDSVLTLLGVISIILVAWLLLFHYIQPPCSRSTTIIPKGTTLNGVTIQRDMDYNTLVKMNLVYGPVNPAGVSASMDGIVYCR